METKIIKSEGEELIRLIKKMNISQLKTTERLVNNRWNYLLTLEKLEKEV